MRRANIATPEFATDDTDPPGYRSGLFRLGALLGASRTGLSVYELPPGQALCPYHYEFGEEEWLIVLSGTPSVRDPDGIQQLAPWDVVCFVTGPEGAHQVRNDSAEPARVVMFSNTVQPSVSVYPDSDKVGIWPGDQAMNFIVERSSAVDYWHGET